MLKPCMRVFLAEVTAGAKALRQEGAFHIWRSLERPGS